jgi:hypothetical protein
LAQLISSGLPTCVFGGGGLVCSQAVLAILQQTRQRQHDDLRYPITNYLHLTLCSSVSQELKDIFFRG